MYALLIFALTATAASAAAPAEQLAPESAKRPSAECLPNAPSLARDGMKAEARRLGELPSGDLVLTVLREENGCTKPVIVRQGFGAADSPTERPPSRK